LGDGAEAQPKNNLKLFDAESFFGAN
jgi:hypothetical protein